MTSLNMNTEHKKTIEMDIDVVEELQAIEAENPNLFAALAAEDRSLIRNGKK
jgi:hypothetical protein